MRAGLRPARLTFVSGPLGHRATRVQSNAAEVADDDIDNLDLVELDAEQIAGGRRPVPEARSEEISPPAYEPPRRR